jgi:hypothetical protein
MKEIRHQERELIEDMSENRLMYREKYEKMRKKEIEQ